MWSGPLACFRRAFESSKTLVDSGRQKIYWQSWLQRLFYTTWLLTMKETPLSTIIMTTIKQTAQMAALWVHQAANPIFKHFCCNIRQCVAVPLTACSKTTWLSIFGLCADSPQMIWVIQIESVLFSFFIWSSLRGSVDLEKLMFMQSNLYLIYFNLEKSKSYLFHLTKQGGENWE